MLNHEQRAAFDSALKHLAQATKDLAFAEQLALSAQALDLAREVAQARFRLRRHVTESIARAIGA